ncbi:MAG: hypothetical protein KatS3mg111_3854 [Pirellulaceae bacterium]|nr:MAG: hypothetical protein KatS3mg111_3854 [Pirellulaceae bacterium]
MHRLYSSADDETSPWWKAVRWWRFFVASVLLFTLASWPVFGDSPSVATILRGGNPTWFDEELSRLRDIADQLRVEEAIQQLDAWIIPPREDWTVLYLPVPLADETVAAPAARSFARAFNATRRQFADQLYEMAQQAARQGREHDAFRLLWRTLRENPDHALAARVLGSLPAALTSPSRVGMGRVTEPLFQWPARSYRTSTSAHFRVTSRAAADITGQVIEELELFHALWSQVFYPLWAPPGWLSEQLEGNNPQPLKRPPRAEVYLFADRTEYLHLLGGEEANIAVSVGYYHPELRKSFFYPGEGLSETLQHELTHQLLQQRCSVDDTLPGRESDIWLVEGVALYMESLRSRGTFWTVGGIDAPRVQVARYRGVRDGFWPSWPAYASAGLHDWKTNPQISLLYAHALGLTHALMDLAGDEKKRVLMATVADVYRGKGGSTGLVDLLGRQEEEAKERYQDLLIVTEDQMEQLAASAARPRDLVLCGSKFHPQGWAHIGRVAENCQWLDLSFTNGTDDDLQWIGQCRHLRRLSLEGTTVGPRTLRRVFELEGLEELDLTGCRVDDEALEGLTQLRHLHTLWLGETRVTAAVVPQLRLLPKLERCDLSGTLVPDSEIAALQSELSGRSSRR